MFQHDCYGVKKINPTLVTTCYCLTDDMRKSLTEFIRSEMISEIQAFANEFHHHIEGRDVVIVDQLLDFLKPIEGEEQNGLGSPR